MPTYKIPLIPTVITTLLLLHGCGGSGSGNNNNGSQSSSSNNSTSSSQSNSSTSSVSLRTVDWVGVVSDKTDLPDEMRISRDGFRIERGGFYESELYDETALETIYLDFPQEDYWQQLLDNYQDKIEIAATLTYKGEVYENVGARFRGFSSYFPVDYKKPFAIKMDWMVEGQDIDGYDSLNLNNTYQDPSNMREVLYYNLSRKHIASAKANFVNLVVNGENYGVYANVQQLDKKHVKEWFLDNEATRWRAEIPTNDIASGSFSFGAGVSTLNGLGADGASYENYYTLNASFVDDPWQDLANAANTMANTSSELMYEELGQYLDIDSALWMIATEIIFADDDGYVSKGGMDYFVYFDVATGRIIPIEYDGNSAMYLHLANTWSPFIKEGNEDYPLMNILLKVPELRQRYLAHVRTILRESVNATEAALQIDNYVNLIDNAIQAEDAVKIYTYEDFLEGVDELKEFFVVRENYLSEYSEVDAEELSVSNVNFTVEEIAHARPTDSQNVVVSAAVTGSVGVNKVNLYYGTGLMGTFERLEMSLQGNGNYEGTIPTYSKGTYVRYYIEAIANNNSRTATYEPEGAEHDVFVYQVQSADVIVSPVIINELLPANKTINVDEDGDFGDWVELYNNSDQSVDLSGYYITDDENDLTQWEIPAGTVISANDYLMIWADDKDTIGNNLHANFKLDGSGETLFLVTPGLQFADVVIFGDGDEDMSFGRIPNGTGDFQWMVPSYELTNN